MELREKIRLNGMSRPFYANTPFAQCVYLKTLFRLTRILCIFPFFFFQFFSFNFIIFFFSFVLSLSSHFRMCLLKLRHYRKNYIKKKGSATHRSEILQIIKFFSFVRIFLLLFFIYFIFILIVLWAVRAFV